MNKQQIRCCFSYPGSQAHSQLGQDVATGGVEPRYRDSPPPEIAIVPAPENCKVGFEIDEHTGLPKLPVELPLPGSPETVRADQKPVIQLPSALRMSTSPSQRKSVTFGGGESETPNSTQGVSWHANEM